MKFQFIQFYSVHSVFSVVHSLFKTEALHEN